MISKQFDTVTISNPRDALLEPSGVITVTIDYEDEETTAPEEATYVLVEGDEAPAARWLRGLIEGNDLVVTPASPAYMNERYWQDVRYRRNSLLSESDIAVLPDRWAVMSPEEQQAWAAYRQALRDIPQTHTEPLEIEWPVAPGET